MRTNSNTARTGLDIPQSLSSAPDAFSCRRHESIAPSPELSMNRRRPRSKIRLACSASTGAMSRLKSATLLASSSSPCSVAIVTAPNFSTAISIGRPLLCARWPAFHERDAVPAPLVAIITHIINRVGDQVQAEAALPGTVKHWRSHRFGIEASSAMVEPEDDMIGESVGLDLDPLIGATAICMTNDVAGRLGDRELQLRDGLLVDRWIGERAAEVAHKGARRREF